MLKRDRGTIFAIGLVAGVALALLFFVWSVPEFRGQVHQSIAHSDNGAQGGGARQNEKPDESQWAYWSKRLISTEDTLAQWVMAFFAVAGTIISYRAVVLVDSTLKANIAAVAEAQNANRLAERTADRQLRAYLAVTEISVENAQIGLCPLVSFQLKNFGLTPATDVRVIAEAITEQEWRRRKGKFLFSDNVIKGDRWRQWKRKKKFSLAPQEIKIFQYRLNQPFDGLDFSQDFLEMNGMDEFAESVLYYGVVSYRDHTQRRRWTTFCYHTTPDSIKSDGSGRLVPFHGKNSVVS